MAFRIASSPFTHNQQSTQRIMLWVIFACIPGIAAQAYFFGYGNLIQCALAIVTTLPNRRASVTPASEKYR